MKKNITAALLLAITGIANSQQLTKADYDRAVSFQWPSLLNKKVFNAQVDPVWARDSSGFAYVLQSKEGKTYHRFFFSKKTAEPLFDQAKLAVVLNDKLKLNVKPADLPVNLLNINKDTVEMIVRGKRYKLDLPNYNLNEVASPVPQLNQSVSPNGEWIAYAENYNLFIRSTKTGEKKQLSHAGVKDFEYATWYGWSDIIEGENGKRPEHFDVKWSPDSKWIQTNICDLRSGNKMYLLDWSVDTLYRARLLSYYRASPGDTGMVYMLPVIFNVETGEEIHRDAARSTHTFPAYYEWSKQPGIIYEQLRKRGFQEVSVSLVDLNTKTDRLLYSETSKTNIDNYSSYFINEWNKILILSEKDGWKQLYQSDPVNGTAKPVTNGQYYIDNLSYIDRKTKQLLFSASGKEAGRNPYYRHLYRIHADGKNLALLTPENADHTVSISPDGKYFVDNYSTVNEPTKTVLRSSADGKVIATLSTASVDGLLEMGYKYPEVFTCTARDGQTTIYGVMWKPSNFNPAKKYPVIDQSYTGPHTSTNPRNFSASLSRNNQALAELGFIVVTVDGMGTAGRSKAFQSISYKNMGKNLLDHVIAIRELGKRYSWADTSRVGIFGHSAGGYDAGHAVLEFPDFYKVAVATSADHDFRMEKDWWPEMYMGWPVDSSYNQVSNITMAKNLKGKLLIVHGGIDENVNPSATFKLAEALVNAGKEFDMLILPGQRHGYTGRAAEYVSRKRWNYFVEHLLGVKPIWEVIER